MPSAVGAVGPIRSQQIISILTTAAAPAPLHSRILECEFQECPSLTIPRSHHMPYMASSQTSIRPLPLPRNPADSLILTSQPGPFLQTPPGPHLLHAWPTPRPLAPSFLAARLLVPILIPLPSWTSRPPMSPSTNPHSSTPQIGPSSLQALPLPPCRSVLPKLP